MSVANPYFLSQHVGQIISDVNYKENLRRTYDIHDTIYGLYPQISTFCQFQMAMNRAPTTDKLMIWEEEREQSTRQLFKVETAIAENAATTQLGDGTFAGRDDSNTMTLLATGRTDEFGRLRSEDVRPIWFEKNKTIAVAAKLKKTKGGTAKDVALLCKIVTVANHASKADTMQLGVTVLAVDGQRYSDYKESDDYLIYIPANSQGFAVGSVWGEASRAPDGHRDFIYANEAYLQIFKEAAPLMSGTQLAMKNRGYMHEWDRNWRNTMYRYKLQIANAFLFNTGYYSETFGQPLHAGATDPAADRATWGIIPYIKRYGYTASMDYQNTYYDHFVDLLEQFFQPEKGLQGMNVTLFASRKIVSWFAKIGNHSFMHNSMEAASGARINDQTTLTGARGPFGFWVMSLNTRWGTVNIIEEPLLRGPYEDTCFMTTMEHLAYRFLPGREAKVMTDVQDNDIDGRKDMILGEVGLQVRMPETHMVIEFTNANTAFQTPSRWNYGKVA